MSLTAPPGRRIGLVGENGVGKTTLLRLLAGLEQPDSGEVHRPEDVGFLPQEPSFSPRETLADVLDRALDEYRQANKQLRELSEVLAEHPDDAEALADYGRVLEWAEQHALWDVDHRADEVLAGLG
ncbi:ATP-binding cassette domain-containing protein, partial [Klebsiella pneumoniae]|nr:ATP-binding cassette domain-containing protein [Klebsiella pneumoniae]